MDVFKVVPSHYCVVLYVGLAATVVLKYLLFMTSMCQQLTEFLGIRLLRVKPIKKE